jgi:hypothetical protein
MNGEKPQVERMNLMKGMGTDRDQYDSAKTILLLNLIILG